MNQPEPPNISNYLLLDAAVIVAWLFCNNNTTKSLIILRKDTYIIEEIRSLFMVKITIKII